MEEVPSLKTSSSSDEEFESRDEECKPSEDDNQYKLQDGNISNPAAPPPPEGEDEKSVDILLDEEQIIYSDVIFRLQRQVKDGKNANLSNSQNEKKQENEAEESGLQSMLFDNYVTENKKPKKSLSRKRIRKSAEIPAYPWWRLILPNIDFRQLFFHFICERNYICIFKLFILRK